MFPGSRLINISASWLTQHRTSYQAWATTAKGQEQLARALLAGPAPLRSPLSAEEERRVLAQLDASLRRAATLQSRQEGLQADVTALRQKIQELRQRSSATEQEMDDLRQAATSAERAAASLRRQLTASEMRRRRDKQAARTREVQREKAAQLDLGVLRQRLAMMARRKRRERHAMAAIAGAAQSAERAAAEAVLRLRSRAARLPLLRQHLKRSAAGDAGSEMRRDAKRLLAVLK